MVFYLSPKDTFVSIGRYRQLSNLKVTDVFYDGFSENYDLVTLPSHPISISCVFPASAVPIEAVGYDTIATIGDALVTPHTWNVRFLLFYEDDTKNFIKMINDVFHNAEPLVVFLFARKMDGSTYYHFVSPIAVVNALNIQGESNRITLGISLVSPYTSFGEFENPQFGVLIKQQSHNPILIPRLFSFALESNETDTHNVLQIPEIISFAINIRRNVTWHYTTAGELDSYYALRAPTKFTVGHEVVGGTFTMGLPFHYVDLQTVWLKRMYTATLSIEGFMQWIILFLKASAWRTELSGGGRPTLSVEWNAFAVEFIGD